MNFMDIFTLSTQTSMNENTAGHLLENRTHLHVLIDLWYCDSDSGHRSLRRKLLPHVDVAEALLVFLRQMAQHKPGWITPTLAQACYTMVHHAPKNQVSQLYTECRHVVRLGPCDESVREQLWNGCLRQGWAAAKHQHTTGKSHYFLAALGPRPRLRCFPFDISSPIHSACRRHSQALAGTRRHSQAVAA